MGTDLVDVIHIAVPRAMPIIASVVRNEGMPIRVVSAPLTRPTSAAGRKACGDAGHGRRNGPSRRRRRSEISPATMPMDRSISPADKHIGHADRHDRDHRGLPEDVELVVRLEEALVEQGRREEGEDQHEAEIGNVLPPVGDERTRRARVLHVVSDMGVRSLNDLGKLALGELQLLPDVVVGVGVVERVSRRLAARCARRTSPRCGRRRSAIPRVRRR